MSCPWLTNVHKKKKRKQKKIMYRGGAGGAHDAFGRLQTMFIHFPFSAAIVACLICPAHCTRLSEQPLKTSLQCATRHSQLQYSLSQSRDSAAGLGQPVRMHRSRPPDSC